MTRRIAVLVSLSALVLALLPAGGAAAQDGPGWLYVARNGDIIALRPDGTDQRNLTADSAREYAEPAIFVNGPDVTGGAGLLSSYVEFDGSGQATQSGVHEMSLDNETGEFDFDPLTVDGFELRGLSPSPGYFSNIYFTPSAREVQMAGAGSILTVVDGSAAGWSVREPDASESREEDERLRVAYTAVAGGSSAVRYTDHGEDFADTSVAADQYSRADYPQFYDISGENLVYTCAPNGSSTAQVCLSAIDGSSFRAVPTPVEPIHPAVSPENFTDIAFQGTDGSVWVMGGDGSSPQMLLGPVGSDFQRPDRLGLAWGEEIALRGGPPNEEPPPADPAPNTPLSPMGTDFNPNTTERAEFSRPGPFSTAVSESRFSDGGVSVFAGGLPTAQYAVLGRDDAFADSLAGSPLTSNGPLLFTPSDGLDQGAATELQRVLEPGGTVYLLGGTVALDESVEQAVTDLGFLPVRLAGPSRFETATVVARQVVELGGSEDEVIVARGVGPEDNPTAAWADSVTGGAYAAAQFVPVVVTPTESIHPAVQAYIDDIGATATLLGGTAALDDSVQQALPGSRRIAGLSRADTAAQIATDLLGLDASQERDVLLFDAFAENGWTFGLAGAGLAADRNAALLASGPDFLPPETETLLSTCGDPQVETLILGWAGLIPQSVADRVDELDGDACP